MDLKELYQDIILEHGKSPRNFGKCKKYTHNAKGHNPLCGDQIQLYLKLDNNKKVENLTFEGSGCAISIASTSIMEFLNMIKNEQPIKTKELDEDQKTKIMSLSGVKQYPMRVKCATLAWHTLTSAMDGNRKEVNTEVID